MGDAGGKRLGSFLLGFLMSAFLDHATTSPVMRAFWAIGLLGAFTTYSTFSYETVALTSGGDWMSVGVSIAANLGLGIGAAFVGLRLGAL